MTRLVVAAALLASCGGVSVEVTLEVDPLEVDVARADDQILDASTTLVFEFESIDALIEWSGITFGVERGDATFDYRITSPCKFDSELQEERSTYTVVWPRESPEPLLLARGTCEADETYQWDVD